jgi:hypothetical protein
MQYRFVASNGQIITATATLSMNEWANGDGEGGEVDVVYFPPYPKHNRLDDSRYIPFLACSYLPFVLVTAAMLAAGWRIVGSAGRVGRADRPD